MLPPRRNIYDRLSEKRLADLERQRVIEAQLPKGNFTSGSVAVVNAWVWLPCGVFDTPLSADELALRRADFDHDPRLVDSRSLRRPLRRLDTPAVRSPAVNAAGRAAEILKAMFAQWDEAFCSQVDWSNTQVMLFTPTALSELDWLAAVCRLWPRDQLPYYAFDVTTQSVAQWLPEALGQSYGAPYLLCLSLDTWACKEQMKVGAPDEMAGEAVSAVLLQRESSPPEPLREGALKLCAPITEHHASRYSQTRNDTTVLESLIAGLGTQTGLDANRIKVLIGDGAFDGQRLQQLHHYARASLPGLDLERQIRLNTLGARVGTATEQWTQIGLAWLAASAEPGSAAWILDRGCADQTQGWLIG
ncbi:hypothetical protein ACTACL_11480 [Pseudomonas syringae]|uniref:hypothetical protein n=1 Tax=Pseudomonas syringae TaxID=317 RepID=UPI003F7917C9